MASKEELEMLQHPPLKLNKLKSLRLSIPQLKLKPMGLSKTLWLLLKSLTEAILGRLQQSILHSLQLLDPQWVEWRSRPKRPNLFEIETTLGTIFLDLFTWTHMLIFSTSCQHQRLRYVDSEGTFVRQLSLASYPYQLRATLNSHDPVIVLVDSEIEQAILAMAGDLTRVREVYPSENGIDWVMFQYHLALMQHAAPMGWTAPGFRMGGRFPLAVQNMCQRIMSHDAFANCHTTPLKDWHKVKHMLTLRKDPDTSSNYARDAIQALCQYNAYALENSTEVEQLLLDALTMEYSTWAPELDTISNAIRTGGVVELPAAQVEQLERQSRDAEEALIQQLRMEDEANARRREKNRERKEKRSRSSNPNPPQPTVSIRDYEPPPESSSDEGDVAKQLDFEGEARSQKADAKEPNTPEQLLTQPNQPSSPRESTAPPDHLEPDQGYDPGPPPMDVVAPERVEEQQSNGDNGQAEEESEKPHLRAISRKGMVKRVLVKARSLQDSLPTLLIHRSHQIQMIHIQILMRRRMRKISKKERQEDIRRVKRRKKRRWMKLRN